MKLNNIDKDRYLIDIDESKYLIDSKNYIKNIFSCEVEIYNSDDKNIYDPSNKVRNAIPLRPAIFVE
jgi:hypothetical protein